MGAEAGLKVMALTDHDTAEGVPLFLKVCDRLGLRALSGIEMSAAWPGTLHLTGYGFRMTSPQLQRRLDELKESRNERNERLFDRLAQQGMRLSREEVEREAGGGVIGRPHFGKALVGRGYARDLRQAFDRWLGQGKICYVEKKSFPPEQCISMIREAGGRVALAHPYQTGTLDELKKLVPQLKEMGLWGIECYSGHHNPDAAVALVHLARDQGLAITGGSDFHGSNRPDYKLGIDVPEELISWRGLGFPLL